MQVVKLEIVDSQCNVENVPAKFEAFLKIKMLRKIKVVIANNHVCDRNGQNPDVAHTILQESPHRGKSLRSSHSNAWLTRQRLIVNPTDRRRLDLVIYSTTPLDGAF